MQDDFGRTITVSGNTYSVPGMTVSGVSADQALAVIDAHAPEGWEPPAQPKSPVISWADFLRRFTDIERAASYRAKINDTSGQLGALYDLGAAVGTIDLSDPQVKAALDVLVSDGALTAERETEVLTP